ncbi:homoserine dehydrogenase [Caenimonas sedimenti]|uniref:Homoserine dehydrogenase n=1 Tax=Caenimonas sedimenti TaxID=2596921 RepID=A0A562ZMC2_9BURK|nr:homoserine dehydrogenase [Caenimonas sedimenti]TWO69478.1 homoserine dehydrogenase [Caenimonas sedimenti]
MQASPPHHRPALRAGLLGFGVVGSGTHGVLQANRDTIRARAGCAIDLKMVATRTASRARMAADAGVEVTQDPMRLARHPELDVVIEAMGGTTDARHCVLEAIAHGKHVVTANKALLATHGEEIFAAAGARGVTVGFEGAVAVSIPIVKTLREGLVANEIEWLAGIVNGTSNYVLTQMGTAGRSFAEALAEAQALGYAEADPSLDVGGGDAAHKLALLAAMAFGGPPRLDAVHVEGIAGLQAADFLHAARLGFAVKLLAVAQRAGGELQLRVHPALVPRDSMLGRVEGRMNGIMVKGDAAGVTMYYGAGAGSRETASAVVADLVDLARGLRDGGRVRVPPLGFHDGGVRPPPMGTMEGVRLRNYLRVALDEAKAGPRVIEVLARHGVQAVKGVQTRETLVVLTAEVAESRMVDAMRGLEGMDGVRPGAVRLRVEALA